MNRLVYLSLTKWDTYEERPHHFVRWYHSKFGGRVLWVNPYPTRLPVLADFKRTITSPLSVTNAVPEWLTVVSPVSLPIEPLPFSSRINKFFWRSTLRKIEEFSNNNNTLFVIGKPSKLALTLLKTCWFTESWYDIMDSYSDFYSGYSRNSMLGTEIKIIRKVNKVFASSTNLVKKWENFRSDIKMILNGLVSCPPMEPVAIPKYAFGYLGTMSSWFDWEFIRVLSGNFPNEKILLIGPVYTSPSFDLPGNVKLIPPMNQIDALGILKKCKVGLIPFKRNNLTEMVDPIKYYEYTAMGLPTLTTPFGQMRYRSSDEGVFVVENTDQILVKAKKALQYKFVTSELEEFVDSVLWSSRFDDMLKI